MILNLAFCSHLSTCRISAFIVLAASLIDFPYRLISSTVNLSSVDSLLLFKTASNSLSFKLLTVSLYLFISGVIFIFYDHRHHSYDVCILLPYITPFV